jgi:hypothetical protein
MGEDKNVVRPELPASGADRAPSAATVIAEILAAIAEARAQGRPILSAAEYTKAIKHNWGERWGLEQGKLQWAWRQGERTDERELEDAICDALQMGGILAHPGDGVSCAAQIASYWMRRALKAEARIDEALSRGLSDGAFATNGNSGRTP